MANGCGHVIPKNGGTIAWRRIHSMIIAYLPGEELLSIMGGDLIIMGGIPVSHSETSNETRIPNCARVTPLPPVVP